MLRKIILSALGLLVIALGVWVFFTPYIAWTNMRHAAAAHDTATLSSYIDYPALKESLKADLNALVTSELKSRGDDSAGAFVGAMLAGVFVNQMVDVLVTPGSVAMMIEGIAPNAAAQHDTSTPATGPAVSMGYKSFDRFAVSVEPKGRPAKPIILVLKRDGFFSWRLAAVSLPNLGNWLPKLLVPSAPSTDDDLRNPRSSPEPMQ